MEAEEEQAAEDIKVKGLHQIDEAFIVQMASSKKANWGGIWKSIKKIDKDSNGFLTIDELDEIFREWFPVELEGKSPYFYFKRFVSVQNKTLVNYKKIKESINRQILQNDKIELQRRMTIREALPQTVSKSMIAQTAR